MDFHVVGAMEADDVSSDKTYIEAGGEGSCSTPQGQEGGDGELRYLCKVEFILTSRAVQVTSKSEERSKGRPSSA